MNAALLKIIFLFSWAVFSSAGKASHQGSSASRPSFNSQSLFSISTDTSTVYKVETVQFKSGINELQGRLILPINIKNKLPVILFIVGSGKGSTMDVYKPFIDSLFFNTIPINQVAIFYFDKRGVGDSQGNWYKTNFEERAEDAKAAADYLKSLPFVDQEKITIAGHSQGGWITQICLAKYPDTFKAGLSLAGPTFDVREQIRNEYSSQIMCEENISEEEARRKALRRVNFHLFLLSLFPLKEEWKQLNAIKNFHPAEFLLSVEKPLWLVFAENDPLVSPYYSKLELKKIFAEGLPDNIKEITVKGANHSFKLARFCHSGSTKDLHFSTTAKDIIKNWVELFLLN